MPYAKHHRKEKERERRIKRRTRGEFRKYYPLKNEGNWNKGKFHPNWKGGMKFHSLGYVWIWCPTHPLSNKRGYVLEHRLVIEKHLGRTLLPTEVVHHINGITNDNRIENLQLFSNSSKHKKYHHLKEKQINKMEVINKNEGKKNN